MHVNVVTTSRKYISVKMGLLRGVLLMRLVVGLELSNISSVVIQYCVKIYYHISKSVTWFCRSCVIGSIFVVISSKYFSNRFKFCSRNWQEEVQKVQVNNWFNIFVETFKGFVWLQYAYETVTKRMFCFVLLCSQFEARTKHIWI